MKASFFSKVDPDRKKKAWILILVAVVSIFIAIPGMIFSKGNSLFAILNFAGFTLLFYSLLHPWQKVLYYAMSLAIFVGLLILIFNLGVDLLVNMERDGKLPVHGAEDLAWAVGGVFAAGILANIIGIIRSLIFKYDDEDN